MTTPEVLQMHVARIRGERIAQGLPATIADAIVLADVATIIRAAVVKR
jgi:hypothetical protein